MRTALIISQVYVPDPAAAGQHLHDAARHWVAQGWRVIVLTAANGHQDPQRRYPLQERLDGVEIRRIAVGNLGKASMSRRLLGGALFMLQSSWSALRVTDADLLLISTSPPMAPPVGAFLAAARRLPLALWILDINPDQAVVSGALSPNSPLVRLLDWGYSWSLHKAHAVITLDRFMAERLRRKLRRPRPISLIPPWPLAEQSIAPEDAHPGQGFRLAHGLEGKLVFMYSGNISSTHPLDTLLAAVAGSPRRSEMAVVIIGDGTGAGAVTRFQQEHPDAPLLRLPFQPKAQLQETLAAADIHWVSLGADQVGIVHPCKAYGVLAVGRPFIFLGPVDSHLGDLIAEHDVGWQVDHGDHARAQALLHRLLDMTPEQRSESRRRARATLTHHFSRKHWLTQFTRAVVSGRDV